MGQKYYRKSIRIATGMPILKKAIARIVFLNSLEIGRPPSTGISQKWIDL
jgi:hypothetical protein